MARITIDIYDTNTPDRGNGVGINVNTFPAFPDSVIQWTLAQHLANDVIRSFQKMAGQENSQEHQADVVANISSALS